MTSFEIPIHMVMPATLLENSIDKRVSLLLKDGRFLEGRLAGFAEYMNMVLEETLETSAEGKDGRRLGKVILRGNNVVSIALV